MKKVTSIILRIVSGSLLIFALSGCSGKKVGPSSQDQSSNQNVVECGFPDDARTEAPLWVCNPTASGYKVTAVGISRKSKLAQTRRRQAEADGRAKLSFQLKLLVQAMIKDYARSIERGEHLDEESLFQQVSRQITEQTLAGVQGCKYTTSPENLIEYALVCLDDGQTEKYVREALEKAKKEQNKEVSENTEKALNEMEEEISKHVRVATPVGQGAE